MNDYPLLARVLLDSGDAPHSVAAFLRADYGLDNDQAEAAIALAHRIENADESSSPASPGQYRRP